MRKWLKRLLLVGLVLVVLLVIGVAVFLSAERKSGVEKWEQTLAAYQADGESIDRSIRFARPVPDEQNFGAIPLLRGITLQAADGDALRAKLNKLGLRHDSRPWPKMKPPRNDNRHKVREKIDLALLHDYFLKTGLLPVSPDASDITADLGEALAREHGGTISALLAAKNRPEAVFLPLLSTVYEPGAPVLTETIEHLRCAGNISQGIWLHGLVALRTGNPEVAAACVETMSKLADACRADGKNVISLIVSLAISARAIDIISEGIGDHAWSDPQLATIQDVTGSTEFPTALVDAFRGELTSALETLDEFERDPSQFTSTPDASSSEKSYAIIQVWANHNRAVILDCMHQGAIAPSKEPNGYLQVKLKSDMIFETLGRAHDWNFRMIFARLVMPPTTSTAQRAAAMDVNFSQATAACALERYYLAKNSYPDNLRTLVPMFTAEVPKDPIDNQAMRYRKSPDGRYLLYSIGWDGEDNNGGEGDDVWSYSEPTSGDVFEMEPKQLSTP